MENLSIELPQGVSYHKLYQLACERNVIISLSEQRNFTGGQSVIVNGETLAMLDFFIFLEEQYGKQKVIRVSYSEKGETKQRTIGFIIKYLKHLISK